MKWVTRTAIHVDGAEAWVSPSVTGALGAGVAGHF